jgi:hypothetical protein
LNYSVCSKVKFILVVSFLFVSLCANASHILGGELTWTCTGSGEYIFKVKLFKDCNGIPPPVMTSITTNAPGWSSGITCNNVSTNDISSVGPGCPSCGNPGGQPSSVMEVVYTSDPVILTGVPPATGWYFYYTDCCRNGAVTNLSGSITGNFTLRAFMYPFNGQNANPCFDSSPQFAEPPVMATSTGDHVKLSHSAFDPELDSLAYSWDYPFDGTSFPFVNCNYSLGYSFQSPTPGHYQSTMNTAASLGNNSGMISYQSFNQGLYVLVTKVTSYKCGVKTAEVFREISQTIRTDVNGVNSNSSPIIVRGVFEEDIFVIAGDTAFKNISSVDNDLLPIVYGGNAQTITLDAISPHFGTNDTSFSVGCMVPPCAVMSTPMPITDTVSVSSDFVFPTSCTHAGYSNGCLQHQRCFSFLFKFKDNFCPINGVTNKLLNVYVSGPEIVTSGNDLLVNYPGASFQWCLNGVPIPGAVNSVYTPVASGIYTVIATSGSGCSMLSNAVNRSMASVFSLPGQDRTVYVYPNPVNANHTLNVQLKDVLPGQSVIFIYDNSGHRVKSVTAKLNTTADMLILDISELKAGHYTLSFTDKLGELTKSFVVE